MSWIRFMYWVLVVALYPFMVVMSMALTPVMGFLFARDAAHSLTRGGL